MRDIEEIQNEERQNIGDIANHQQQVGKQLQRETTAGRAKQILGYGMELEEEVRQPSHIHQEM